MAPTGAMTIQRVYRGFTGRLEAKVRRKLQWAALMMVSSTLMTFNSGRFADKKAHSILIGSLDEYCLWFCALSAMCLPEICLSEAVYGL